MKDRVYCGMLISSEELSHSSGPWKNHGYVKKTQENGYTRYWYPGDMKGSKKVQSGASEEELTAAEEEYNAALEAYKKDKSDENRKRLDTAEENLSRAQAERRNKGEQVNIGLKEAVKKQAKEEVLDLAGSVTEEGKKLLNRQGSRSRSSSEKDTRSINSNRPISRKQNLLSNEEAYKASKQSTGSNVHFDRDDPNYKPSVSLDVNRKWGQSDGHPQQSTKPGVEHPLKKLRKKK